ncbi:MAG TPA: hypothetical protein VHB79_28990 [Polyangiaceae bacterium]|nr:hypothetical protein [Polyangiaceae bacterium]
MKNGVVVLVGLLLAACGSDDKCGDYNPQATTMTPSDSLQCCMLRTIAMHCSTGVSTQSLLQSAAQWRQVGESRNADACKQLIDSENVGCSGASLDYGEPEAVAACN